MLLYVRKKHRRGEIITQIRRIIQTLKIVKCIGYIIEFLRNYGYLE